PGVRLYLEMVADVLVRGDCQQIAQERLGAPERAEAFRKHRDMKMDSPFARCTAPGFPRGGERFRQIEVPAEPPFRPLDDLVQVNVVRETLERPVRGF